MSDVLPKEFIYLRIIHDRMSAATLSKETHISAKETHISAKEPYI